MFLRSVLVVLLLAGWVGADTSSREIAIQPSKFSLLRSIKGMHGSLLSPAGQYMLRFSGTGGKVYDLKTGKELGDLDGHTQALHDGYFSDDGELVATSSNDGSVKIWNTKTREELQTITGHDGFT